MVNRAYVDEGFNTVFPHCSIPGLLLIVTEFPREG